MVLNIIMLLGSDVIFQYGPNIALHTLLKLITLQCYEVYVCVSHYMSELIGKSEVEC